MTSAAEITIVCLVAVGIAVICVLAARAIRVGGPPRPESFRGHADRALDIVNAADVIEQAVDYDDRWQRLIDPAYPEYNALAEFANNLHPSLRRDRRV